jgi:hypothetical protein
VAALVLAALVFAGFCLMMSFAATIETESPEQFSGWRANYSDIALIAVLPAVAVALAGLWAAWLLRTSRGLCLALGLTCGLLLAVGGYRAYTLVPMLACAGPSAVAEQPDGSYECFDR